MILLRCPYCNKIRHEEELRYGGEAGIARAADPAGVSDESWTDYLYMWTNPKGTLTEQWCCEAGCGQWFIVTRDTVTHAVTEVRRFPAPASDGSAA